MTSYFLSDYNIYQVVMAHHKSSMNIQFDTGATKTTFSISALRKMDKIGLSNIDWNVFEKLCKEKNISYMALGS